MRKVHYLAFGPGFTVVFICQHQILHFTYLQFILCQLYSLKLFLTNREQTEKNKIIDLKPIISIITANVNDLNKTQLCVIYKKLTLNILIQCLKAKDWRERYAIQILFGKFVLAVLISYKVDFKKISQD